MRMSLPTQYCTFIYDGNGTVVDTVCSVRKGFRKTIGDNAEPKSTRALCSKCERPLLETGQDAGRKTGSTKTRSLSGVLEVIATV
jgi:hypothetical protein